MPGFHESSAVKPFAYERATGQEPSIRTSIDISGIAANFYRLALQPRDQSGDKTDFLCLVLKSLGCDGWSQVWMLL